MGDNDHGGSHPGIDALDQVVQLHRGDGIQPGGRLVKEQDRGVQGHGPGQPRPLLHAPGDLRRQVVFITRQVYQAQLHPDDEFDGGQIQVGIFLDGQGDIFRQGHGTEQRPGLKEHPEIHAHLAQGAVVIGVDVDAVDQNLAGGGFIKADQVLQHGGLAAAAASQDHQDFAPIDRKAHPVEDGIVPETGRELVHDDDRGIFRVVHRRTHQQ